MSNILIDVGDGTLITPPPAVTQPPPTAAPPPVAPTAPSPAVAPAATIPQPGTVYIETEPGVVIPQPPVTQPAPTEPTGTQPVITPETTTTIPQPGTTTIPGEPGRPEEPAPPAVTTPSDGGTPTGPTGVDQNPMPTAGDWTDPESGDGNFTDADWQRLLDELAAIESGERVLAASDHPAPGTIIGEPYQGTHARDFNIRGGSDNWESENAVDIWLYPSTHLLAVEDGVISPGGWGFGLSASGGRFAGWRLHLVSTGGKVFYYTHMAGVNVVRGQHVKRGDFLGVSGVANGVPHLHFAVIPPFDPHVWADSTWDKHAKLVSGEPPIVPVKAKPQPGLMAGWRDLLTVLGRDVPAAGSNLSSSVREMRKAIR